MPSRVSVQGSITERLDAAIAAIIESGHQPTGIFLVKEDRDQLDEHATRVWRSATGSTAYAFPSSYEDLPLYSEKLVARLEIPVRESLPAPRRSAVYGSNGVGFPLDLP